MVATAGYVFASFGLNVAGGGGNLSSLPPSVLAKIDPAVQKMIEQSSSTDRLTVAVHIHWNPNLDPIKGNLEAVKSALKSEAAATQGPVIDWLTSHNAVVVNHFWLTNVILTTGTSDTITQLGSQPAVEQMVPNFAITLPAEQKGAEVIPSAIPATWNIAKVRAPEVWENLGITGAGVRVATTDTGVNIGHPDLAGKLWTDNPSDPTFPGGWIEYDGNGNIVTGSTPHDTFGHGTATLGLIVGGVGQGSGIGNGFAVGMAPQAIAMHALTLPNGGGTFAQVIAGLQWVIDPVDQYGNPAGAPARVSSHSWGAGGYQQMLVEPIRNMRFAGHIVVASIGNCGNGCTGSPGNIFETIAAGSTTQSDTVSSFSSGAKVCKSNWPSPPSDWPECYIKPDLSAPGENVVVPYPPNTYIYWSGTSFSSPHIGGLATLMLSANPSLSVDEVEQTMEAHAFWQPLYSDQPPDTRYGWGRIDAYESVLPVAFKQGIKGLVKDDSTGKPVGQAVITVTELGRSVKSKADGTFDFRMPAGTYTVQVQRFAYLDKTIANVVVPPNVFIKMTIALTVAPQGTLKGTILFQPATGTATIGIPGVLVDVLKIPVTIIGETGWDGTYSIALPVGTYAISSRLTGFSCGGATGLTILENQATTADLSCVKVPTIAILGDFNGQLAALFSKSGAAATDKDWSIVSQVGSYDLIVLGTLAGNPGKATFTALISAADKAGTGVMFLDNWGGGLGWYSGLYLRYLYMGSPQYRAESYTLFTPTWYEVMASHPIFGNAPIGTKIIREPGSAFFNDHAWFWDFSGNLQILAWMGETYCCPYYYYDGYGIAVQQRANNRHILMSMSGPTVYQNVPMWTADHNQLLQNAATWTARSPTGAILTTWDTVVDGQWTLQPSPSRGIWSEDTHVPIGVKNVGTASGKTDVTLNVAAAAWATQTTATLAPGGQQTLDFGIQHWFQDAKGLHVVHDVNPVGKDTSYPISSNHLTGAFVIRPPAVTVSAFTIDVPIDPIPLQDAKVEILWKDDGLNPYATGKWNLISEGSIGADGSLAFASPRSVEDYTIVVRAEHYGVLVQRSYLLTNPVNVNGDAAFGFAPTASNAAVVNLAFDQKDVNHDALVYLTSPDICSEAKGCTIYPYDPATLVATPNFYAAAVLFTWQTLDATWFYPTYYQGEDYTVAGSYTLPFGGDLSTTLKDVREQAAPDIKATWDVNDAHGWSLALIANQAAGQFQAKSTLGTQDWGSVFASSPATVVNPKLALFSPGSKILRTGSFGWAERPKAISFSPAGAGTYGLLLRVDTGPWESGMLESNAKVIVPARTVEGWVLFPGATVQVMVSFDAPMAGDTSVGLQENLPSGFTITGFQMKSGSSPPRDYNLATGGWIWAAGDYKPGEIISLEYTVMVASDISLGTYSVAGSVITGTGVERATAGMQLVRVVAQPKGAVMGMVQEISGDFFDGATISLWQGKTLVTSTMTDQYGEYVLLAPQGDYTLTVSRTGYTTTSTAVHIDMGQATQRTIKDDWKENGQLKFAPMPLKPDIRYVLAVLDRWTNKEISTQTMAVLINYWKAP